MRNVWQLWSGYLSKNVCNNIIEYCCQFPSSQSNIGFGDQVITDNNYRNSIIRWVDPNNSVISPIIVYLTLQANKNAFNYDIYPEVKELQFSEYQSEELNHYDWHYDTDWNNPDNYDRKLSVIIQLSDSDDYQGGDFLFERSIPQPNLNDLRKQGSILIFPSFLSHKICNVTFGKRYSLVTWIHGPKFK